MSLLAELSIATPGLSWKPLDVCQKQAMMTLISEMERVDNPPYRTTAEEISDFFASEFQGLSGWDSDGHLVAYAIVRIIDTNGLQAVCSGGVGINWRNRGVGSAIFQWEVATARKMLQGRPRPAHIVCYVDQTGTNLSGWMRTFGFEKTQSLIELRRDLRGETVEPIEAGQYLHIVPWSPELDDQVRRAHNQLMELTAGAPGQDQSAWEANRSFFAPHWSFVALDKSTDRAEVAGYILSACYQQDWEAMGRTEGYTEMLGILPQYAQTKVAQALLSHTLAAYQAAGMQFATVGMAADNSAELKSLYEYFGYQETGVSTRWVMEVKERQQTLAELAELNQKAAHARSPKATK